jgi:hypothetical protein
MFGGLRTWLFTIFRNFAPSSDYPFNAGDSMAVFWRKTKNGKVKVNY